MLSKCDIVLNVMITRTSRERMKNDRKGGDNIMANSIGAKLKTLRKGRKLTQQELADKLGITRCTVSNYEVGRRSPHISELKRFADYFGVGLDYFGVTSTDEAFDLLSRAKEVFNSPEVSKEKKDELYKELMRLYLEIK
jgi:transcriptional regulator with XRE-family HTH domain